jgi:hypothetical protein
MQISEPLKSTLTWVSRAGIILGLLLWFLVANGIAQPARARVQVVSAYTQTIAAIRNNQKTSIRLRSLLLRVSGPSSKAREYVATILYDPRSRLLWWELFEENAGYNPKLNAELFVKSSIVYVAPQKLVVVSSTVWSGLGIRESDERVNSLDQAQDTVVRFLEKQQPSSYQWPIASFRAVEFAKAIPRDFFRQCFSAMLIPPTVKAVQRRGNQWQVKLTGPNGNSAELLLDDGYHLVSTKLLPRPPVIVEQSVDFTQPVKAFRNGRPVALEARELVLNIGHGCDLGSVEGVLEVYDSVSKLFLSIPRRVMEYVPPEKNPLPSTFAKQFFEDAIFVIVEDKMVCISATTELVRQSSLRYSSLQEAQDHLLAEMAKPNAVLGGEAKHLPLKSLLLSSPFGYPPPAPLSWTHATRESGRWRLEVESSAGPLEQGTVFYDDNYTPLTSELTFRTKALGRSKFRPNTRFLMDAMRKVTPEQLTWANVLGTRMTDKSASIHIRKDGKLISAQAFLFDIGNKPMVGPLMGRMLVVYEPFSQLFWCIYQPEDPTWGESIRFYSSQFEKGDSWLTMSDDKIVGFDAISSDFYLGVQESTLKFSSVSQGINRALAAISDQWAWIHDGHRSFETPLPDAFVEQPTKPFTVAPRFLDITPSAQGWRLVLEGARGQQAIVMLNESYEPVHASVRFTGLPQR